MNKPLQPTFVPDRRQGDRRRVTARSSTTGTAGADRRASMQPPEWLAADQAVRYLGLPSRKALYQAVRRGQVPVHRLGTRRMRFRRAELDQLLERSRPGPVLQSS